MCLFFVKQRKTLSPSKEDKLGSYGEPAFREGLSNRALRAPIDFITLSGSVCLTSSLVRNLRMIPYTPETCEYAEARNHGEKLPGREAGRQSPMDCVFTSSWSHGCAHKTQIKTKTK